MFVFAVLVVTMAFPASATFVHSVGRDHMIRTWVDKDLDAIVVDLTPIMHKGNPAYRLVYRLRSGVEDVEILVRADDFRTMKPTLMYEEPGS